MCYLFRILEKKIIKFVKSLKSKKRVKMIVIKTVSEDLFSLNGLNYAKIYQPLKKSSTSLGFYNIFTGVQLGEVEEFSNISVDGNFYNSLEDLNNVLSQTMFTSSLNQLRNEIAKKVDGGGYEGTVKDLKDEIDSKVFDGAISYQTLSELNSVSPIPENGTSAKVVNDNVSDSNNGYYSIVSGSWVKDFDLYENVIEALNISKGVTGKAVFSSYQDLKNDLAVLKLNLIGVEIMDSSAPPIGKSPSDTSSTIVTSLNDLGVGSDYKTVITQIGTIQGQGIFFVIPEEYRVIGKKIVSVVKYRATEEVPLKAYMKNGGAFINNGGATDAVLYESSEFRTVVLSREYEAGANIFNWYCTQNRNSEITIVSAKLMVEDVDLLPEIKTSLIGSEIMDSPTPPISGSPSDSETTYTTEKSIYENEPSEYKTTIVQGSNNIQGQGIFAPIPEEYRIDGLKLDLCVKYTSTKEVPIKGYMKNNGIFINNGGAADATIEQTEEIKEVILSREYEVGANLFNFYFNQNIQATTVIYSAQLKADSSKVVKLNKEPNINIVTIDNNGVESFNLITNTLRAYSESVVYGQEHFEFVVMDSDAPYNENDIRGLNSYRGDERGVVVLRPQNWYGATIKTDGNSTNENFKTPLDYAYSGQGDKVLNDIPSYQKHTFWLHESMDIEYFIIHTIDCKYCVHQDTGGQFDSLVSKNLMIQEKINDLAEWRVVGIGTRYNQVARYHDNVCKFINNTGSELGIGTIPMMMFWHNSTNQSEPTTLEMVSNKAINCGIGLFTDVGSGQNDVVILDGNTTNLNYSGIEIQSHETNVNDLYNVNYVINGEVNYYKLRDRSNGREEVAKNSLPLNSYLFEFINKSGNNLEKGIAVKKDFVNDTLVKANDENFTGVIWRDVQDEGDGFYIPKGKAFDVYCVADNYQKGDSLTINSNGEFQKSLTGVVAYVLKSENISSGGYLKVISL